jgi:hypothetical protein
MSASARARRLLRWYSPAWRDRYGEEFAALLDDTIGDGVPSVRLRLDVMRSGTVMRLREAGLWGDDAPPAESMRGGALAVLCAWSVFVVAGIALQKTAEHWHDGMPGGVARTVGGIAFGTVQVTAAIASILVVAGAIVVLPTVARFLSTGGWRAVRRPYGWAALTCTVTVAALGALIPWARDLTVAQRNGADTAYTLGALAVALLAVASIAALTNAGVATVRRLELSPRVLRSEARLAEAVAAAIVVMTIATGVWGVVVVTPAPQNVVVATLMLAAAIVAVFGARRAAGGARRAA